MTEAIQTVRVELQERSYDIQIGTGILNRTGPFVASLCRPTHAVIITDENVQRPYADRVAENVVTSGANVDLLVVEPGEPSKSLDTATSLWETLLELGTDRTSVVLAVGGGVVGDLAGFIAATYARGIAMVQLPTTLLAQVDSSVGGKAGVNLPGAKNIVGAFWQPLGVLIDTDVLSTLPGREYRAGLAEVVKYGVILDADFFSYLEDNAEAISQQRPDVLRYVIARCCRLKADVVQADEREETGLRAVLNYGHTFCHAIEAVTGYDRFLHGEAVSVGMLCAARLAGSLGRVDAKFTRRLHNLLSALGLPLEVPDVDHKTLLDVMQRDKKVQHGKLRFVLPTRIGHVELVSDVDSEKVQAALVG